MVLKLIFAILRIDRQEQLFDTCYAKKDSIRLKWPLFFFIIFELVYKTLDKSTKIPRTSEDGLTSKAEKISVIAII